MPVFPAFLRQSQFPFGSLVGIAGLSLLGAAWIFAQEHPSLSSLPGFSDSVVVLAGGEAADEGQVTTAEGQIPVEVLQKNQEAAAVMAETVLQSLTMGPPLQAKLRVRAWAAGKEVKEVGSYEQAGRGSGWMRMELEVPIADGKGRWQQTCDGRLAWTREELAGHVRVRRVDVGRVSELIHNNSAFAVSPWLRIGGLAELVDRIRAEYRLTISEGHIEQVPMVVLKGQMHQARIDELTAEGGNGEFPDLVPRLVRIAIPRERLDLPIPARIEFWSEEGGRLITMLEVYDLTEIEPPGLERFRFEPGGDDFANETDLYLARFGMTVAEISEAAASLRRR